MLGFCCCPFQSVSAVSAVLSQPPPHGICTLDTLSAPSGLNPADSSSVPAVGCVSQHLQGVLLHTLSPPSTFPRDPRLVQANQQPAKLLWQLLLTQTISLAFCCPFPALCNLNSWLQLPSAGIWLWLLSSSRREGLSIWGSPSRTKVLVTGIPSHRKDLKEIRALQLFDASHAETLSSVLH